MLETSTLVAFNNNILYLLHNFFLPTDERIFTFWLLHPVLKKYFKIKKVKEKS